MKYILQRHLIYSQLDKELVTRTHTLVKKSNIYKNILESGRA